jgi:arsenate reductase
MIDFYGLKNCDTCRKARNWLDAKGIANVFHDIREAGLDEATDCWLGSADWVAKAAQPQEHDLAQPA